MQSYVRFVLFVFVMCLPAGAFAAPGAGSLTSLGPTCGVGSGHQLPCRGGPAYRWIGLSQGACPAGGDGWTAAKPFAGRPGTLGEICSYDWQKLEDDPAPCSLPSGLGLEPDCQMLSPRERQLQATPFDEDDSYAEELWPSFEGSYLNALQAPRVDLAAWPSMKARDRTMLAIVDAALLYPGGRHAALAGAVQHANYFRALAQEFGGCAAASCAFHPQHYRALYPLGKTVAGSIFDAAIEVHHALQDSAQQGYDHLIVSLGMAFDLDANCSMTSSSLALEALREILEVAVCEYDAINLAPVGNHELGELGQGVMYPAALEREVARCAGPVRARGRPLAVSVSGVGLDFAPLSNSRAPGTLMTVGGTYASVRERLAPRSGSSIATAAVGPILALAWSLRPELDADELLARVSKAATKDGVVRACDALAAVCLRERSATCALQAEFCRSRGSAAPSTEDLAQSLWTDGLSQPAALDEIPESDAHVAQAPRICRAATGARAGGSGPDEYRVLLFPGGQGQVLVPAGANASGTYLELRNNAQNPAYYSVQQSIQFNYGNSLTGAFWWSGSQSYPAYVLDLR